MRRSRARNDETNWRLRDNVTWYTDQAKAVPGLAKDIASAPRAWFGAVKEMVDDMRSDGQRSGDHPDRPSINGDEAAQPPARPGGAL
jgi:hypothetical protein